MKGKSFMILKPLDEQGKEWKLVGRRKKLDEALKLAVLHDGVLIRPKQKIQSE